MASTAVAEPDTSSGGSSGLGPTSSATTVEDSGSSTSLSTGGDITSGETTSGDITGGGTTTGETTGAPATGCSAIDVVLPLDGTAPAPNGAPSLQPSNYGDAGTCSFASGGNYMLGTSELASDPTCATTACQQLSTEYGCAMGLSASGYEGQPDQCTDFGETDDDDEQPAFTAAHALLQPENAGFLRDGALLFVIALTDEDEQLIGLGTNSEPGASVETIAQQIIDAKGGDIEKVVFLGIGGPPGGCTEGPYGAALDSVALRGVTEVFSSHTPSRGVYWNLCDPAGVAGALERALAIVDTACAEMTPAAP